MSTSSTMAFDWCINLHIYAKKIFVKFLPSGNPNIKKSKNFVRQNMITGLEILQNFFDKKL